MLHDFNSSEELCANFLEAIKKKGFLFNSTEFSVFFFLILITFSFQIKILSKSNWPTDKSFHIRLNDDLEFWKTHFTEYFAKESKGYKVLEWAYHLSSVVLNIYFDKKKHEVFMSLYQAAIIFLFFNTRRDCEFFFTFQEIMEKTGFEKILLSKILKTMVISLENEYF